MKDSYFHFDAYYLADEIAEEYELDKAQVVDEICEYFGYDRFGDIAIPVWLDVLFNDFEEHPITHYIYSALISYFDDEVPEGKVYIDF